MDKIYRLIKINKLTKNANIKFLAVLTARLLKIRHISIRIDPITACNLRCLMCSVSNENHKIEKRFNEEDIDRLGELFFKRALQVVIGCGYEPTMSNQYLNILRLSKRYKVPFVGITSNGQLINKTQLEAFIQYHLTELTISMHGVYKETYQHFMKNASYEKLHRLLRNLDELKSVNNIDHPKLRINYTFNSENLDELEDIFNVFGRYKIATLQLRPMHGNCYPSGNMTESDFKKYGLILKELQKECSDRKITLLANTNDLNFGKENHTAIIYPEIFYYINPDIVWRRDFDWRYESYEDYCKRVGYTKYLISSMFLGKKKLLKRAELFPGSGRFDVYQ